MHTQRKKKLLPSPLNSEKRFQKRKRGKKGWGKQAKRVIPQNWNRGPVRNPQGASSEGQKRKKIKVLAEQPFQKGLPGEGGRGQKSGIQGGAEHKNRCKPTRPKRKKDPKKRKIKKKKTGSKGRKKCPGTKNQLTHGLARGIRRHKQKQRRSKEGPRGTNRGAKREKKKLSKKMDGGRKRQLPLACKKKKRGGEKAASGGSPKKVGHEKRSTRKA